MSFSINKLLGVLKDAKNPEGVEGQLYNPDIPDDDNFKEVENQKLKDQFFQNTKLSSLPRNGEWFTLPKQQMVNPRLQSFNMEGSIDPAEIRRKQNPMEATPITYNYGYENLLYSLPKSTMVEHDNVGLIQKAHASYLNYKNRFSLEQQQKSQTPSLA